VAAGCAWIVFVLGVVALSLPTLRALLGIDALIFLTIPLLVIAQCVWLAGTAYRLLIYARIEQ
jgi:hypothetical protein